MSKEPRLRDLFSKEGRLKREEEKLDQQIKELNIEKKLKVKRTERDKLLRELQTDVGSQEGKEAD